MKGLNIVFMGTPEFALPTLGKIYHSHHRITGVVSQPDRPRGRGKKLQPTPVKKFSLDHNLSPILQPESLKQPEFIEQLESLKADVFVVVAFRILPEAVFTLSRKGTINLHPSLLPKYRGAAPIHWTIINGEEKTGITTIFIQKQIDAGNIILQREMPVYPDDTTGTLHDRLAPAGADLILETLRQIEEGTVEVKPQDESQATPAPKIKKEDCHIRFSQSARQVKQWIHGLSPFPGGYTTLRGKILKLYNAQIISGGAQDSPSGTILKAENENLWIACQPGIVAVTELQLAGRKRLKTREFLQGIAVQTGERLE